MIVTDLIKSLAGQEFQVTKDLIIFDCESNSDARERLRSHYDVFAALAGMLQRQKTVLQYPGCRGRGYEVLAKKAGCRTI